MSTGETPDRRFIDFVHANRAVVGGVLIALAVGCVVAAGYCGIRGFANAFNPPAESAPDELTESAPSPAAADVELNPAPYQVGMAAGLIAALGLGGVGAFFLGGLPPADPALRRRRDRVLILVAGYAFGLANRLSGLFLFVYWFGKLVAWVNGEPGSQKEGWIPIAALLQYLFGAGVTFVATLPARSEERNQPWVRRAVYAVNFALSAVLLVVGLVLVNAVVSMKLPERLDTTAAGFYSLSDSGAAYVGGLSRDVNLYVIESDLSDAVRTSQNVRRLVEAIRDANPRRVTAEFVNVVTDQKRFDELSKKYPDANLRSRGLGVLVVTEGEPGRRGYVENSRMAPPGGNEFKGEAELIREMMFHTERRGVAYFTQANGELSLTPPADGLGGGPTRTALRLMEALELSQCEARPLPTPPIGEAPKVPDDADVVVVLDPTTPLLEPTVQALRRFIAPPAAGGKRGRLLVFSSPHPVPGGKAVQPTGLEPLLEENGMSLQPRQLLVNPADDRLPPDVVFGYPVPAEAGSADPIQAVLRNGVAVQGVRPIDPVRGYSGELAPRKVVVSQPALGWYELEVADDSYSAFNSLVRAFDRKDVKYLVDRRVLDSAESGQWAATRFTLAASANDRDGKPVILTYGFAAGLADDPSGRTGAAAMTKVFTASVDWLRERPAAPDITPKTFDEYVPRKGVDMAQLVYVPVIATLLAVVLLGLGVWVVRRK